MSSGTVKNRFYEIIEEKKNDNGERCNIHNHILQRELFHKLAKQFINLTKFKNKKEFTTYSNKMITTLLTSRNNTLPDTYSLAIENNFSEASLEAQNIMLKEFGIKKNEKINNMEYFF